MWFDYVHELNYAFTLYMWISMSVDIVLFLTWIQCMESVCFEWFSVSFFSCHLGFSFESTIPVRLYYWGFIQGCEQDCEGFMRVCLWFCFSFFPALFTSSSSFICNFLSCDFLLGFIGASWDCDFCFVWFWFAFL